MGAKGLKTGPHSYQTSKEEIWQGNQPAGPTPVQKEKQTTGGMGENVRLLHKNGTKVSRKDIVRMKWYETMFAARKKS